MTRSFIIPCISVALLALPAHAVPFKQFEGVATYSITQAPSQVQAPKPVPAVPEVKSVSKSAPTLQTIKIDGRNQELVDIKLLKQRPAGAGGILPFRVSDVRNQIDPETRSVTTTSSSATTALVTCPDGTRFPAAFAFAPSVDLVFPASGNGACSMAAGPSALNGVLQVDSFTTVSAAVTGLNGWVANITTLIPGLGGGLATPNVQISKGGVTYRMTLTVQTNGAGGGSVIISSFVKL
ncbi:MAG: hypothetical protein SFW65_07880 [Alphaproteobacteria bacterium]|nr:hypothetical protein [Alphaproteobacteria bacterium]